MTTEKNPLRENEKTENVETIFNSLDDKSESQVESQVFRDNTECVTGLYKNTDDEHTKNTESQVFRDNTDNNKILDILNSLKMLTCLDILNNPKILAILNSLDIELKVKVLLLSATPKTIKEISEIINVSAKDVRQAITRQDSQSTLLAQGLINEIEGTVNKYVITKEGIKYIEFISDQENQKLEFARLEREKKEYYNDKIQKWAEYLNTLSDAKILYDNSNIGCIMINFTDIASYLPEMAECILDNFEEEYNIIKVASSNVFQSEVHIKFYNFPKSERKTIGHIRNSDIGKLISIPATVLSYTDVMVKTLITRYECPSCGNIISVIQTDKKVKEPNRCGCGRKGKFRVISKQTQDTQILKLEELPELLDKRVQQSTITAYVYNTLCDSDYQHHYQESKPIIFNAVVLTEPIELNSTTNKFILEIHSIEFDKSYKDINITEKDIKEFKEFADTKDPIKEIINHFAPEIVNRDMEKTGMILSLVSGGLAKKKKRDDSHLLLVGDPSQGKSYMMKSLFDLYPLSRWVSGKGSSGVGLIGSVNKDEQTKQVMISKGALALANNNAVLCDELDKMNKEDRNALHEPMENQFTSIDKYNKHIQIQTDTTMICASNPKYSHFDKNTDFIKQIDLPPTLLSRFDLIFVLVDEIDYDHDKQVAETIINSFESQKKTSIDINFIRKYLYYVRRNIDPKLSNESNEIFVKYYIKMRQLSKEDKKVYITPRQIEGLIRLAKASAKINMREKTNSDDSELAIELMNYTFKGLGVDDMQVIETGISMLQTENLKIFDQVYNSLIQDKQEVEIQKLSELVKFDVDEAIEVLKQRKEYMITRPGFIKRVD